MPHQQKGSIIVDATSSTLDKVIIRITDSGDGFDLHNVRNKKESYGIKNILEKIYLLKKIYGLEIAIKTIAPSTKGNFTILLEIPSFSTVIAS